MCSCHSKLVGCWVLMLFILGSEAGYNVTMEMQTYSNPLHYMSNGECCDEPPTEAMPPNCISPCDNSFIFCWKNQGSTSTSIAEENCISRISTSVIPDSDNLVFPTGTLPSSAMPPPMNPMSLTGSPWPGGIQMFVRVVDGDGTDRLLVDHIRMNVALSPGTTTPFTVFTGLTINVNLTARFSLTCDPDYYGLDCNIYCSPQDSDELGHYTCAANGNKECLPGYREPASDCKECAPGSGCSPVNGYCNNPNECICNPGYGGTLCDQDLDVCGHLLPCLNGATCVNLGPDSHQCDCLDGYSGTDCEIDDDVCGHTAPCQNGATCNNTGPNTYECMCTEEFGGENCDIYYDSQSCSGSPCQNGGTCISTGPSAYRCECPEGYMGLNCSDDMDMCTHTSPCQNGATCSNDGANSYDCQCMAEYTGIKCDVPIELDICNSAPCRNGGTCITIGLLEFVCVCTEPFGGGTCQDNFDMCGLTAPCKNNGTCLNAGANAYSCLCSVGYTGNSCQLEEISGGSNENNDVIIAASMVALVAIIVVLVAFICLAVCCGKRGRLILVRKKPPSDPTNVYTQVHASSELTTSDVFSTSNDHQPLVKISSTNTNSSTADLEHDFGNPLYNEDPYYSTAEDPQRIATLHYYKNSDQSAQVHHYQAAGRSQVRDERMYYVNSENVPANREPFYNTAINKGEPLYYGNLSRPAFKKTASNDKPQNGNGGQDEGYCQPADVSPYYPTTDDSFQADTLQSVPSPHSELSSSATYHVLEPEKPQASPDRDYHVLESSVKMIKPGKASGAPQQSSVQEKGPKVELVPYATAFARPVGMGEHDYSVVESKDLQDVDVIYEEADVPALAPSLGYMSQPPPDYDSIHDYAAPQEFEIYANAET